MNPITKTFTVTANPEMMLKIEGMLAWMHFNTRWGHSATIATDCDGDGSDTVTVEGGGIERRRDSVKNIHPKTKLVEWIGVE